MRFQNCGNHTSRPTDGEVLNLELVTDTGVHTLSAYNGETLVAQGSRTGNGSITLAEENSSGISLSDYIVALLSDFALGKPLSARAFLAAYYVYYQAGDRLGS